MGGMPPLPQMPPASALVLLVRVEGLPFEHQLEASDVRKLFSRYGEVSHVVVDCGNMAATVYFIESHHAVSAQHSLDRTPLAGLAGAYLFVDFVTGDPRPPAHEVHCEEHEELEDLPAADIRADPYFQQHIVSVVDGVTFIGHVEYIEVGKESREKLYLIRYDDGDLQHLTVVEVKEGRRLFLLPVHGDDPPDHLARNLARAGQPLDEEADQECAVSAQPPELPQKHLARAVQPLVEEADQECAVPAQPPEEADQECAVPAQPPESPPQKYIARAGHPLVEAADQDCAVPAQPPEEVNQECAVPAQPPESPQRPLAAPDPPGPRRSSTTYPPSQGRDAHDHNGCIA